MPNHLINETSPYLLQHADNPVNWYPWSSEALLKSIKEDKPILLSIGYSACHWCHVMAHESFEDQETANLMNQNFINIKVDREERPDLDSIYMDAVQTMTGHGGWPLTVFLTPDKKPFFGGTYFPPIDKHGLPSFKKILLNISQLYEKDKKTINKTAYNLTNLLNKKLVYNSDILNLNILEKASLNLNQAFDKNNGGFGGAPKFPQPLIIEFLLRNYLKSNSTSTLSIIETTLKKMAQGGLYDHIGGGFHRYSVDNKWLIPHFEKMLYDNALLTRVYLHAYQINKNQFYKKTIEESLNYVSRELTHNKGGFYSSQDADSEGEEGKFYLWTTEELNKILNKKEFNSFCTYYNVTNTGNFEGSNILHVNHDIIDISKKLKINKKDLENLISASKIKIFKNRNKRIKPDIDDKIITSWNGLMLASFAEAATIFNRDDYKIIAQRNADFILSELMSNNQLKRIWRNEKANINGYLEDYAFFIDGLLSLYQCDFNERWFIEAKKLADLMIKNFFDIKFGFFDSSLDHKELIIRPKTIQDNAIPSGASMATRVILMLYSYTNDNAYYEIAKKSLENLSSIMGDYPRSFSNWLSCLDMYLSTLKEIAIIGKFDNIDFENMRHIISKTYHPNIILAAGKPETKTVIPLLKNRNQLQGKTTVYICKNLTCKSPITSSILLEKELID